MMCSSFGDLWKLPVIFKASWRPLEASGALHGSGMLPWEYYLNKNIYTIVSSMSFCKSRYIILDDTVCLVTGILIRREQSC